MPTFPNLSPLGDVRAMLNATGLRRNNYAASRAPGASDDSSQGYEVGSQWVYDGRVWVAVGVTPGTASWTQAGADLSGVSASLAALDARVTALEDGGGGDPTPEFEFVAPGAMPSADYRTPTWDVGPLSVGDPDLITWNANDSITLDAEARPGQPNPSGRTWYTGSFVTTRDWAGGRGGAIVEVTEQGCVAAVFAYENDRGREIDFELLHILDKAVWMPNVWMPRTGSSGRRSLAGQRTFATRFADLQPGLQRIEWDLRSDRCDFYFQRLNANLTPNGPEVLFETFWATEAAAVDCRWDYTTVNMEIHVENEFHDAWAGWLDYTTAQMILRAITPVSVPVPATGTPLPPPDLPAIAATLNSAARTVRGGNWTFTNTVAPSRAGFLADNLTAAFYNDGGATCGAQIAFPVDVGDAYDAHISTHGGQLSLNGFNAGWNGYDPGTRRVRFTPSATPHNVTVSNNTPGSLRYGTVKLVKV